jgi:hypothetical protein
MINLASMFYRPNQNQAPPEGYQIDHDAAALLPMKYRRNQPLRLVLRAWVSPTIHSFVLASEPEGVSC